MTIKNRKGREGDKRKKKARGKGNGPAESI